MPRAISNDLRKRIIDCVKSGSSIRAAARRFNVSASFAIKLVQRFNQTGSYCPGKIGGHKQPILSSFEDEVIKLVEAHPDWTLNMYVENLKETHNIEIHPSTFHRFLKSLNYSYKKNGFCHRTRPTCNKAEA